MRKLALIWVIVATVIAAVTTILDLEPASTFIDIFSNDGSFYVIIPVGLTFIICMIPLFIILMINNIIQNKRNKMPADLSGKTGIVVKREKELQNAALLYSVFVNGSEIKKVGMGRSVFIELKHGIHSIQVKAGKKFYSLLLELDLPEGKILAYSTKSDFNKSITTFVPKGEMIILVQVPFKV
jgi:hypothetical protein